MCEDERVEVIARDSELVGDHDHDGVEVLSARPSDTDTDR